MSAEEMNVLTRKFLVHFVHHYRATCMRRTSLAKYTKNLRGKTFISSEEKKKNFISWINHCRNEAISMFDDPLEPDCIMLVLNGRFASVRLTNDESEWAGVSEMTCNLYGMNRIALTLITMKTTSIKNMFYLCFVWKNI